MDRFLTIISLFVVAILMVSCGQVGTITGGEKDFVAPKPIEVEIEPPMASKNIKPDKITIPFDEFIALNNPAQNMRIVPDDVKLEPSIVGKSLVLKRTDGAWEDTTTYAIYLNGAVKDITEANDSLMIYVFSTGNTIDSLETGVKVVDSYTNNPLKDITVGLYKGPLLDDTSKVYPRYVAITDSEGKATFKYLKEGPFYAYAFQGANKNSILEASEKRGRLEHPIKGLYEIPDTLEEIRLMPPIAPAVLKVRTNEALPPAIWSLGFNQPVKDSISISYIDREPVGEKWNEKKDSVTIFFGEVPRSARYKAAIDFKGFKDTIFKKFIFKEELAYSHGTNLERGVLLYEDTLTVHLDEAIEAINKETILVTGKKDKDSVASVLEVTFLQPTPEATQLYFDKASYDSVFVTLPPTSINGYNFKQLDTIQIDMSVQKQKNVGNLIVEIDTIPPYGFLELLDGKGNVLKTKEIKGMEEITFNNLQPGNYKFRFVIDENKDGKWTTGDIFEHSAPEKVFWFETATTIRANWDVKAKLEFAPFLEDL